MNLSRFGRKLAALSAGGKLALMLVLDGVFLPICAFLAVALGPIGISGAQHIDWRVYLASGLGTVAVLATSGLYRSVVRFIDLKTVAITSAALAGVVLFLYWLAKFAGFDLVPASSVLTYWFVSFAYLLTSRVVARGVLQRGMKRAGRPRRRTLIYGAGSAGVELAHAMSLSLDYQAHVFCGRCAGPAPAGGGRAQGLWP